MKRAHLLVLPLVFAFATTAGAEDGGWSKPEQLPGMIVKSRINPVQKKEAEAKKAAEDALKEKTKAATAKTGAAKSELQEKEELYKKMMEEKKAAGETLGQSKHPKLPDAPKAPTLSDVKAAPSTLDDMAKQQKDMQDTLKDSMKKSATPADAGTADEDGDGDGE